jgi:hypothetical protein
VEAAEEGATVLAPRAHRRHPPVDAQDGMDGTARAAVPTARGIGSRSQHRHLLCPLPLPPRRLSPSLLTSLSLASPSTTVPTRTPSGYPESLARSSTPRRTNRRRRGWRAKPPRCPCVALGMHAAGAPPAARHRRPLPTREAPLWSGCGSYQSPAAQQRDLASAATLVSPYCWPAVRRLLAYLHGRRHC